MKTVQSTGNGDCISTEQTCSQLNKCQCTYQPGWGGSLLHKVPRDLYNLAKN